ncbi:hypothetical protein SAMN05428944_4325 [Streptomyces sp. 1222.5]|uniref:hypothetical protein n=1 Tax=unclassified Streptomyces TaxID=2593676 RepID=UPI00089D68D2|nr:MULTISPECIES: hypothetical protein [unclassified Streptomyces]PKW08565.1 hypothetical protein BX260_3772 [Streptomyces sp. 5112.2]SEC59716.1 hypothetical protein SAMN05428944_4325 [Streptomyces sp. 1222.5]
MTGKNEDQIPAFLSREEGIALKEQTVGLAEEKRWRWMGFYATPQDAVVVANQNPPQRAGEVIFTAGWGLALFY